MSKKRPVLQLDLGGNETRPRLQARRRLNPKERAWAKGKRSTMVKANNKTHLTKERAKERMRANKNSRKTSRSPDRTTAGAKTRTVSHTESATESKTMGVLKRLSTCTHDALKTWWQRPEFLACVAVTSGTTLRKKFIVGFRNGGRS